MIRREGPLASRVEAALLAAVCWVPLLLTRPGTLSADTKTYLYVNPGRVLSEAGSLWNPDIGLGTVTHQYVGYLWPMGPFFWLCETISLPDWVAQRLWWGAILFTAAWGVRCLARGLGLSASGALLAGLAYGLSPYHLQYMARLSGLLLAWAALPWMILCVRRLRRDASWLPPLALSVLVACVGTMNATTLLLVGLGPVLWLVVDASSRHVSWRRAGMFALRTGSVSIVLNAWWIWALVVQGRYGLPILRYTETYETVAKASSPLEIMRGLGYWFFYGGDLRARWVESSATFMQNRIVLVAGFGLVAIALTGLVVGLRRDRANVAALTLVGLGVAVAAAPIGDSGPLGRAFLHLVRNEAGFAFRSTPRAAPLVLLCLAVGVGVAAERLAAWRPHRSAWLGSAAAFLVVLAVAVQANPHLTGRSMTSGIARPETLPSYLLQAADAIESTAVPGAARVYEYPGTDFAAHDWGSTVDPTMAGLASGSYLARELVPYGSDGTADLLDAHESRLQEAIAEPGDLAAFARLISATAVAWRADLDYAAYRTPRPEQVGPVVEAAPPGRSIFRAPAAAERALPAIVDNQTYALDHSDPPLYEVRQVDGTRPMVDAMDLGQLTAVVGDGRGLLAALRAGVISPLQTVVYSASAGLTKELSGRSWSHVVITDSNRRSPRRWYTVYSNLGRTEQLGESARYDDPSDNRLFPFLDDPRSASSDLPQAVSRLVGDIEWVRPLQVEVQAYHTPEDRPEMAFDGDTRTAWRTAALAPAQGRGLAVRFRKSISPDEVTLILPTEGLVSRRIVTGRLVLGAGDDPVRSVPFSIGFGNSHRVRLDGMAFDRMRLLIDSDNLGSLPSYDDVPALGVAEVQIPGVTSSEWLQVADDPATAAGERLSVVLERWRTEQSTTNRSDPETRIARIVTVPRAIEGRLTGTAGFNARADEADLAGLLGLPDASSRGRLEASWRSLASFALDGDIETAWTSEFDPARRSGLALRVDIGSGASRRLRLTVDDSPRHSVPTLIAVRDSRNTVWEVALRPEAGHLVADLPDDLVSPVVSVDIIAVDERRAADYFTGRDRVLPVRILELDSGRSNPPRPATLAPGCRKDLLWINEAPVAVRVQASAGRGILSPPLRIEACDGVRLEPGPNTIRTAVGRDGGLDVNSLVIDDGAPLVAATPLEWRRESATEVRLATTLTGPHVVSFGESINEGWRAIHDDGTRRIDLGRPFVVQGFANGWIAPGPGEITITWTPQRVATIAQWLSLIGSLLVLAALLWMLRRRPVTGDSPLERPRGRSLLAPGAVIAGLGVFAGPIAALACLPAVFLRRRVVGGVVAAGTAALGLVVVVSQGRYGHQPTLDWPAHFFSLVRPTWILVGWALIALVARERQAPSQ